MISTSYFKKSKLKYSWYEFHKQQLLNTLKRNQEILTLLIFNNFVLSTSLRYKNKKHLILQSKAILVDLKKVSGLKKEL